MFVRGDELVEENIRVYMCIGMGGRTSCLYHNIFHHGNDIIYIYRSIHSWAYYVTHTKI